MENSQSNEIRSLKMQVAKLQLESKLRRNLASEIDVKETMSEKKTVRNFLSLSIKTFFSPENIELNN